jgi:hypothetical protein
MGGLKKLFGKIGGMLPGIGGIVGGILGSKGDRSDAAYAQGQAQSYQAMDPETFEFYKQQMRGGGRALADQAYASQAGVLGKERTRALQDMESDFGARHAARFSAGGGSGGSGPSADYWGKGRARVESDYADKMSGARWQADQYAQGQAMQAAGVLSRDQGQAMRQQYAQQAQGINSNRGPKMADAIFGGLSQMWQGGPRANHNERQAQQNQAAERAYQMGGTPGYFGMAPRAGILAGATNPQKYFGRKSIFGRR